MFSGAQEGAKKDQNMVELATMQAQATCGNVGKAFTGDINCDDGHSQVKCK
jgi:chitinase